MWNQWNTILRKHLKKVLCKNFYFLQKQQHKKTFGNFSTENWKLIPWATNAYLNKLHLAYPRKITLMESMILDREPVCLSVVTKWCSIHSLIYHNFDIIKQASLLIKATLIKKKSKAAKTFRPCTIWKQSLLLLTLPGWEILSWAHQLLSDLVTNR